jgi:hypothetical protein
VRLNYDPSEFELEEKEEKLANTQDYFTGRTRFKGRYRLNTVIPRNKDIYALLLASSFRSDLIKRKDYFNQLEQERSILKAKLPLTEVKLLYPPSSEAMQSKLD